MWIKVGGQARSIKSNNNTYGRYQLYQLCGVLISKKKKINKHNNKDTFNIDLTRTNWHIDRD